MQAILVNRVSDQHQLEGYSLAEQEREGRKYAECKGLQIAKVFSFQESASKANQRKTFDEIRSFITSQTAKKETCIAIVAEKHDRLYRNHLNKAQFQIFLEEGRIEIHLYKEGKMLTKDSPPSEFLVDDVMTSVNQYASRNIGREAKKGMLGKAREGWFPHKAPFGYKNVHPEQREDKNRRRSIIEPTPWGEKLIPRMFELRASGHSLRMVHQKVLEEGLVPSQSVRKFYDSLVEKILKNSFYMGEFVWAGEKFQGKHRPLVSKRVWDAVQNSFISKASPTFRLRKRPGGALSGFMKCSCGCVVTYDPKDKPSGRHYDYYRCANGKGAHPKLVYVAQEHIFKEFTPAVESISISEERAKEFSDGLNRTELKAQQVHKQYIEDLKARHNESYALEDEIYLDYKKGILDDDGFKRQITLVRAERNHLADILGQAQSEVTGAVLVTAKKILELAQKAPELYLRQTPEKRREFLDKILSNPILDGVTVRYELKKPFSILSKMAQVSNWGA